MMESEHQQIMTWIEKNMGAGEVDEIERGEELFGMYGVEPGQVGVLGHTLGYLAAAGVFTASAVIAVKRELGKIFR